jgi:hypothetical protein
MYHPRVTYKYVKRKNHIIAPASGRLPLHRFLLWEKIGMGPHLCHYCGTYVNWSNRRTAVGCLIAEHVDGDHLNNDPENLVPACQTCNLKRARDHRFVDGPAIFKNGVRHRAIRKICEGCGTEFLVLQYLVTSAEARGERAGVYCSRDCMRKYHY